MAGRLQQEVYVLRSGAVRLELPVVGGRGSPALGALKEMERAAEAFDLPVPLKIGAGFGTTLETSAMMHIF